MTEEYVPVDSRGEFTRVIQEAIKDGATEVEPVFAPEGMAGTEINKNGEIIEIPEGVIIRHDQE